MLSYCVMTNIKLKHIPKNLQSEIGDRRLDLKKCSGINNRYKQIIKRL